MNYLAHALLSGEEELVFVGNFIGDFVKGKTKLTLPEPVRKGVKLHRLIDQFTDRHPVFIQGQRRLYESHGHFSGIIMDMIYDHIIAKHFSQFSDDSLQVYSQKVYQQIENNVEVIPAKFLEMFAYMKKHNWLLRYAQLEGVKRSLDGLTQRRFPDADMGSGLLVFQEFEKEYTEECFEFWEEIKKETKHFLTKKE